MIDAMKESVESGREEREGVRGLGVGLELRGGESEEKRKQTKIQRSTC